MPWDVAIQHINYYAMGTPNVDRYELTEIDRYICMLYIWIRIYMYVYIYTFEYIYIYIYISCK